MCKIPETDLGMTPAGAWKVTEPTSKPRNSVERSLAEFERGETTVCDTFEDYLKSIEA